MDRVIEGPRYHSFHHWLRNAVGDHNLPTIWSQFHFIRSYIQRTLDLEERAARR